MKISNEELISLLPLIYYGTKKFNAKSSHNIHLKTISQLLRVSSSKLKCILNKLLVNKEMESIKKVGR